MQLLPFEVAVFNGKHQHFFYSGPQIINGILHPTWLRFCFGLMFLATTSMVLLECIMFMG